jgi:hypothetical protein
MHETLKGALPEITIFFKWRRQTEDNWETIIREYYRICPFYAKTRGEYA